MQYRTVKCVGLIAVCAALGACGVPEEGDGTSVGAGTTDQSQASTDPNNAAINPTEPQTGEANPDAVEMEIPDTATPDTTLPETGGANPAPAPDSGTSDPKPDTGTPNPTPGTGTTDPAPDAGTPEPTQGTGTTDPAPADPVTTDPTPGAGNPESNPDAGTPNPAPDTAAPEPTPGTGTTDPAPDTGAPEPTPGTGTTDPAPDAGTTDPVPDPGTTEPPSALEAADCTSIPKTFLSATPLSIPVSYAVNESRDLFVELRKDGTYLTHNTVTVSAGEGTTSVPLNLDSIPVNGSDYLIKAEVRPLGAPWQEAIEPCSVSMVTIEGGPEASMPASFTDPGVVTIEPLTTQFLGEVTTLDRSKFINMHDSFGDRWRLSPELIRSYTDDFEMGHGRIFWSPMAAAAKEIKAGGYPATATAIQDGPASIKSYNTSPLRGLYDPHKIVVTDHPKNIMTPGNDPVEGARWSADYFTYYYSDESRPHFFEPFNEPFVHSGDFKAEYGNSDELTRDHMTKWIAEIGKEFKSRPELQDVNIVGYASAWPSMERFDFGHWNGRMKRFIDNAGPHIDSFSVHLYDGVNVTGAENQRSGSNSQAILDLVETYSMKRLGEVKPHSITEYGNIVTRAANDKEYSAAANSQSIKSFNYILMELLAREDRILHSLPFVTGYSSFHWTDPARGDGHPYGPALWRPNLNNIQLNANSNRWEFIDRNATDNYLLNNISLFFDFWKGVKGDRARVHVNDPDVQSIAFLDGDKAHIILSNLEDSSKTIQLDIAKMLGYSFSKVKTERLYVPADVGATISSSELNIYNEVDGSTQSFGDITLRDNEFVKLTVTFDRPVVVEKQVKRETYYSDDYLQPIEASTALQFAFTGIDTNNSNAAYSSASLRLSIGRKHDRSKMPIVKVNGTAVTVPNDWPGYDQANRHDFFGALTIPVDHRLLTPNTVVEVTFPDAGGHVSSVVLDVNNVTKN